MQALMIQHRSPRLKGYFVWGPFLRSDTEAAAREASTTYAGPNTEHFWTPGAALPHEIAAVLRMAAGRVAWDVYLLYGKGSEWTSKFPAPSYWQHQLDILQGEKYSPAAMEAKVAEALRR
jgi:hypothetical protein